MNRSPAINPYRRHRFPAEIISHCVWLYFRFCLSYRDIEELMAKRGLTLTYEAVRDWCQKFGQVYANALRRRRPRPGDKWHLAEVFLTINRQRHYLWRAVDQDGNILDILVQRRRVKMAAKKFFRKLLKGPIYVPRVSITDKLVSYGAAKWELLPSVEHRQHCYLNNRAENSHQPTRQRERRMGRFKSPGHAQRFLSTYGPIASLFRPRRHRDLDLKQNRLRIHRLKNSLAGLHPLQPDELKALKAYLRERQSNAPALFLSRNNTPISRRRLDELIKRYGERADIPESKRHFHALKHSIATHLLDAGADLRFVQDWVGHASIKNTVIYAQLTSRRRDEEARRVFASPYVV